MQTSKRRKLEQCPVPEHPNGILPSGNSYFNSSARNVKSNMGAFRRFQDELLLLILELLGPQTCAKLARTCRSLYVFSHHEELWRNFVLKEFKGNFKFNRSWRQTFTTSLQLESDIQVVPLKVPDFYSDLLFTSWRCATTPLADLCNPSEENIDRRSNLSMKEFLEEYAIPQKPVILTDVVPGWPAFQKWNLDFFANRNTDQLYRAEAVDISFEKYLRYFTQASEESPLYLFDKFSLKKDTTLSSDYTVPTYFNQDLFQVLGDKRPDYRWIIIGPERSGSTFHIDPNATCAWNAVITGSKKWILTPPHQPPPGVYPSKDGSEVTSPVSLCEWYFNHYQEMKESQGQGSMTVYEAVCGPGEMIFVPARYWHSVMNLKASIAITQNFVSDYNLQQVLEFAKFKPDQVSGFCTEEMDLYKEFVQRLEKERPETWADVNHSRLESDRKTKWQKLTDSATPSQTSTTPQPAGFSFTFEVDEEEEEREE